MDRLDLTHAMICKAIGDKLYLAPLEKEKVHRILDVGTGTGICEYLAAFRAPDGSKPRPSRARR